MISPQEIIQVGRTQKPYGIKGEINILFINAEYAELDSEYYFLMIENIIDEKDASKYTNLDVYIPREMVKELEGSETSGWSNFIGYKVVGGDGEFIGKISSVDESTINTLFILHNGEKEILIPATEDFITAIDEEEKTIDMNLPEGLLEE